MNKIGIKVLNPDAVLDAEKTLVCAARMTQRGHKITCLADFEALYERPYDKSLVNELVTLPHTTLQKFGVINIAVIGASRRFLAQITRHQNEVKFMSASLQYSDYSDDASFVVPYSMLKSGDEIIRGYLWTCKKAMSAYKSAVERTIDNDAAGYMAPQGLRNALLISATPYQWKHMIRQRVCRRNTDETRFVMLRAWEELLKIAPSIFATTGSPCMFGNCPEGKMRSPQCLKKRESASHPSAIIAEEYPLLFEEGLD